MEIWKYQENNLPPSNSNYEIRFRKKSYFRLECARLGTVFSEKKPLCYSKLELLFTTHYGFAFVRLHRFHRREVRTYGLVIENKN